MRSFSEFFEILFPMLPCMRPQGKPHVFDDWFNAKPVLPLTLNGFALSDYLDSVF